MSPPPATGRKGPFRRILSGTQERTAMVQNKDQWIRNLYIRFKPKVYGFFLKKLRSPEDAEDMLSQAFFEITRCADRYDSAQASESTWVYSICRNLLNRRLRDGYIHERVAGIDTDADVEEVYVRDAVEIDRYVAASSLTAALAHLSPNKRNIIILAYYFDWSPSEISAGLHLSYSNVCALKSRALKEMEAELKGG
jgi:RNA polymerase sigma-70 factor (ECF subfamily)